MGSGFISSRLNHCRTIVLSSVLLGLVLLGLSQCSSLWAICLGLFFIGISAGIYIPSGIATITSLFTPKNWGKALAIHELAPNISFLSAPLIARFMMSFTSWRGILGFLGIFAILFGAIFAVMGSGGDFPGEAPRAAVCKRLLRDRSFWIMMVLFSLGIGGTLGIYTMLPLYLVVEKGLDQNWANTLISISRISSLFMVFVAGWATDRLGPERTLRWIFLLTGIMTVLLGMTSGSWLVIALIFQPVLAVCFFPAGFAALAIVVPPETRNVAVSLTVPLGFIVGGGIFPIMIGMAGDYGLFAAGIVITGIMIMLGTFFSRQLEFRKQQTAL